MSHGLFSHLLGHVKTCPAFEHTACDGLTQCDPSRLPYRASGDQHSRHASQSIGNLHCPNIEVACAFPPRQTPPIGLSEQRRAQCGLSIVRHAAAKCLTARMR